MREIIRRNGFFIVLNLLLVTAFSGIGYYVNAKINDTVRSALTTYVDERTWSSRNAIVDTQFRQTEALLVEMRADRLAFRDEVTKCVSRADERLARLEERLAALSKQLDDLTRNLQRNERHSTTN